MHSPPVVVMMLKCEGDWEWLDGRTDGQKEEGRHGYRDDFNPYLLKQLERFHLVPSDAAGAAIPAVATEGEGIESHASMCNVHLLTPCPHPNSSIMHEIDQPTVT